MSTVEKAREMLVLASLYELSGVSFAAQYDMAQLAQDFNGIGPEWFPEKLRKAIDKLDEDLQPVAFIHDVRWSHSDGTDNFFKMSNTEFKDNGYIVAKTLYKWYDPRRYLRMNKARVFGNLCQHFGYSAYCTAYNKQKGGK